MINYKCPFFHLLKVKFLQKAFESFVICIHSIHTAIFGVSPSLRINIVVSVTGLLSMKGRKSQVISGVSHHSQITEGLDLEMLVPFWFVLCNECLELV